MFALAEAVAGGTRGTQNCTGVSFNRGYDFATVDEQALTAFTRPPLTFCPQADGSVVTGEDDSVRVHLSAKVRVRTRLCFGRP